MKICQVPQPFDEPRLRLLKQIGVDHVVYYDMSGMSPGMEALELAKRKVESMGMSIPVVESGPAIDRIVLGKDGRKRQVEDYKRAIGRMGQLGIQVLCYNFMPQITDDAMVIRTSFEHPTRGGALTSCFRREVFDRYPLPHHEKSTTDEEMWDNLEYFLRQVVPAAEEAGVLLAMHPDDPPISPLCGLSRILSRWEDFDRLLRLVPSPVNGITLCQGCFVEMGADLTKAIEHFREKIHFVHFRDVKGAIDDFVETFPDDGSTDMMAVFKAYKKIGYKGFIRSDHAPRLATDEGPADGYRMQGHIFAIGYMKGIMEAVWGGR